MKVATLAEGSERRVSPISVLLSSSRFVNFCREHHSSAGWLSRQVLSDVVISEINRACFDTIK